MPTPVYLHIGTRKSGTTSVRQTLWRSADELAAQGVNVPYTSRIEQARHLVQPVKAFWQTGDDREARQSLRELAGWIRERPEMTHLISAETLAQFPREAADLVVGELAEFEVHVVVTARNWTLTLPSEWQQGVKDGRTVAYRDQLTAVRDRTARSRGFLAKQDVAAIVDRWGALLPPEQVHLIACPPRSRTEGTLLELFCGVVGIDPTGLRVPPKDLNTSISLDQAELIRRVNLELGPWLRQGDEDRTAIIRGWMVRGSMRKRTAGSVRLPAEFADWAAAAARQQYDDILATGVDIVGDPTDLLPDDDLPTGPFEVEDDLVAAAAVSTLADLAKRQHEELRAHRRRVEKLTAERNRLRRQVRVLRRAAGSGAARDRGGLRQQVGRIVRKAQQALPGS